jgi:ppGpp synthetase/RelA/SpoT-type nucleotidyltranferase
VSSSIAITPAEKRNIKELVALYQQYRDDIRLFVVNQIVGRITETKDLFRLIHSIKWRLKDPAHLRDKLFRKVKEARINKEPFDITTHNLFAKINDLGGVRLLHLHTRQFKDIHDQLLDALAESQLPIIEGPTAKTWDDETRDYFRDIGVATEESPSMYTSVHYVIESNTRTKYTCELQVRTLAEELWGEVSHVFNYPRPTRSVACGEQIKVLARVTSGCSRLVDSVFRSHEEFKRRLKRSRTKGHHS